MSEEQKAELEATQAEAQEVEARDEQSESEVSQETKDDDSQQFEAILKRERESREKAEKAAAELAFKLREKKRKGESVEISDETEDEAESEDKPLTARDLQEILARERESTRKEMMSRQIDEIANKFSTNEIEKQLIITLHQNRSFPSHLSIEEQLEECYLLANKKKILGENSELKRALVNKSRVYKDTGSGQQDSPAPGQPKLAPADASELVRVGYKWNPTSRVYEKKLGDGSRLVYDHKTKQTRREV